MDQHSLPALQVCDVDQHLKGRETHERQRRGFDVAQARRLLCRGGLAHQGELGERADTILIEPREDLVADLEGLDVGANLDDDAGQVVAKMSGSR
jgi:hypothetical protein